MAYTVEAPARRHLKGRGSSPADEGYRKRGDISLSRSTSRSKGRGTIKALRKSRQVNSSRIAESPSRHPRGSDHSEDGRPPVRRVAAKGRGGRKSSSLSPSSSPTRRRSASDVSIRSRSPKISSGARRVAGGSRRQRGRGSLSRDSRHAVRSRRGVGVTTTRQEEDVDLESGKGADGGRRTSAHARRGKEAERRRSFSASARASASPLRNRSAVPKSGVVEGRSSDSRSPRRRRRPRSRSADIERKGVPGADQEQSVRADSGRKSSYGNVAKLERESTRDRLHPASYAKQVERSRSRSVGKAMTPFSDYVRGSHRPSGRAERTLDVSRVVLDASRSSQQQQQRRSDRQPYKRRMSEPPVDFGGPRRSNADGYRDAGLDAQRGGGSQIKHSASTRHRDTFDTSHYGGGRTDDRRNIEARVPAMSGPAPRAGPPYTSTNARGPQVHRDALQRQTLPSIAGLRGPCDLSSPGGGGGGPPARGPIASGGANASPRNPNWHPALQRRPFVPPPIDRTATCPFLLRVFYSLEKHISLEDFMANAEELHEYELQIYTWKDATVRELCDLIKDVSPEARARGCRLSFQVIYTNRDGRMGMSPLGTLHSTRPGPEDRRSLQFSRFNIGDFISLAIISLPSARRGLDISPRLNNPHDEEGKNRKEGEGLNQAEGDVKEQIGAEVERDSGSLSLEGGDVDEKMVSKEDEDHNINNNIDETTAMAENETVDIAKDDLVEVGDEGGGTDGRDSKSLVDEEGGEEDI